ncbi:MAG: hypothetical protein A4S09_07680 [Proteobacteria bacterium SG_bin7]|nr:MAG: hypothetical protein A4S09_07680 [Proteobacteria bacterium SG_bin7]
MQGQCRYKFLVATFLCAWALNARSSVPEALEGLLVSSKNQGSRSNLSLQSTESMWRSEGTSILATADIITTARNSFTIGYYQTLDDFSSPKKNAYFLRYDYTFLGTQSVSLKWLHNDWNYIPAAQENIALEYNGFLLVESLGTGAYYSIGIYKRWLKQIWNENYQSPFSFQTEDTSFFAVAALGLSYRVSGNLITFDFNNRSTFNFYNTDDVGTDLTYYWQFSSGSFLRMLLGTRWSGFFTYLPGYATTSYLALGYSW